MKRIIFLLLIFFLNTAAFSQSNLIDSQYWEGNKKAALKIDSIINQRSAIIKYKLVIQDTTFLSDTSSRFYPQRLKRTFYINKRRLDMFKADSKYKDEEYNLKLYYMNNRLVKYSFYWRRKREIFDFDIYFLKGKFLASRRTGEFGFDPEKYLEYAKDILKQFRSL